MHIESYSFNDSLMEIIYYSEEDINSTLLQAPACLADDWLSECYDTTLIVESYDYPEWDITQVYLPQSPEQWLDQLPASRLQETLNCFVNYCKNAESTGMIIFNN